MLGSRQVTLLDPVQACIWLTSISCIYLTPNALKTRTYAEGYAKAKRVSSMPLRGYPVHTQFVLH